jgi:hypothetical protein
MKLTNPLVNIYAVQVPGNVRTAIRILFGAAATCVSNFFSLSFACHVPVDVQITPRIYYDNI